MWKHLKVAFGTFLDEKCLAGLAQLHVNVHRLAVDLNVNLFELEC